MKDYSEIKGLLKHVENQFEKQLEAAYDFGYILGIEDGNINDGTFHKKIQEAYQNGLDTAWEHAKRLHSAVAFDGLGGHALYELFGFNNAQGVILNYSVNDVIEKLKQYDANKSLNIELSIGDEVEYKSSKYVVTVMANTDTCLIMSLDGSSLVRTKRKDLKKTGIHYQQIEDFMKQMRGES